MKAKLFKLVVIAALVAAGYGVSYAYESYTNAFNSLYGTAGSAIDSCELCHIDPNGGGSRNAYGNAFRAVSTHSSNPTGAFTTIQNADSDGDGYTNLVEINARTFPGDSTSRPSASTACTSYTYTLGACQPNNTALVLSYTGIPSGCSGGAVPATTQPCTYSAPTCTSYTYTLGACQPNNTAPVLSYVGNPSGCSGGLSPATTQPCTYAAPPPPVPSPQLMSSSMLGDYATTARAPRIFNLIDSNAVMRIWRVANPPYSPAFELIYSQPNSPDTSLGYWDVYITPETNSKFVIRDRKQGNLNRMTIDSYGNVGIGTTTPTETLEVNGGIRMNPDVLKPVCDSNERGALWFTQGTTNDVVEVCAMVNGSLAWRALW